MDLKRHDSLYHETSQIVSLLVCAAQSSSNPKKTINCSLYPCPREVNCVSCQVHKVSNTCAAPSLLQFKACVETVNWSWGVPQGQRPRGRSSLDNAAAEKEARRRGTMEKWWSREVCGCLKANRDEELMPVKAVRFDPLCEGVFRQPCRGVSLSAPTPFFFHPNSS